MEQRAAVPLGEVGGLVRQYLQLLAVPYERVGLLITPHREHAQHDDLVVAGWGSSMKNPRHRLPSASQVRVCCRSALLTHTARFSRSVRPG